MLLTMVNGKVCNALSETTSTQCCYICHLTSKDFTDMEKSERLNVTVIILNLVYHFIDIVFLTNILIPQFI
mgnify:CR=1 FL=1